VDEFMKRITDWFNRVIRRQETNLPEDTIPPAKNKSTVYQSIPPNPENTERKRAYTTLLKPKGKGYIELQAKNPAVPELAPQPAERTMARARVGSAPIKKDYTRIPERKRSSATPGKASDVKITKDYTHMPAVERKRSSTTPSQTRLSNEPHYTTLSRSTKGYESIPKALTEAPTTIKYDSQGNPAFIEKSAHKALDSESPEVYDKRVTFVNGVVIGGDIVANGQDPNLVYSRSEYIKDFQSLESVKGIDPKQTQGFEAAIAHAIVNGDRDIHERNMGVVGNQVVKVDSGHSGLDNYSKTKEGEQAFRLNLVSVLNDTGYINKDNGQIKYPFSVDKLKESVDKLVEKPVQEVRKEIHGRVESLYDAGYDFNNHAHANITDNFVGGAKVEKYDATGKNKSQIISEVTDYYTKLQVDRMETAKEFSRTLDIINKSSFKDPEKNKEWEKAKKDGSWLTDMQHQDVIKWATKKGLQIEGKSPEMWAKIQTFDTHQSKTTPSKSKSNFGFVEDTEQNRQKVKIPAGQALSQGFNSVKEVPLLEVNKTKSAVAQIKREFEERAASSQFKRPPVSTRNPKQEQHIR
jgi:hypothetical protein